MATTLLMKEVSGIDPLKALGFNKNNKDWMIENENNVWKYFVENDLLFSTQSSLDYRFLLMLHSQNLV